MRTCYDKNNLNNLNSLADQRPIMKSGANDKHNFSENNPYHLQVKNSNNLKTLNRNNMRELW